MTAGQSLDASFWTTASNWQGGTGWDPSIWRIEDGELPVFDPFDDEEPTEPPPHTYNGCCIDYTQSDVTVPGSADGFEINLTKETLTIPAAYTPAAFSIDGGTKWRPVTGRLSAERFPRLLNRDMTLHISDKPTDRKTKKPPDDAAIVRFAKINKRAPAPRLTINYLIGADPTGNTSGEWLLTERKSSTAVKNGVQIGVADAGQKSRVMDTNGFGHFYSHCGICVMRLTGPRVTRHVYFIRTAPTQTTAASRPRRIRATSEQRAVRARVRSRPQRTNRDGSVRTAATVTLPVRKNTYSKMNGEVKLHNDRATLNVLNHTGTIELWTAATVRRPAGAKLVIER